MSIIVLTKLSLCCSVRMNKTDELSDFSSQSILCAMDRFVKAVNHMNETVMVPCRSVPSFTHTHCTVHV